MARPLVVVSDSVLSASVRGVEDVSLFFHEPLASVLRVFSRRRSRSRSIGGAGLGRRLSARCRGLGRGCGALEKQLGIDAGTLWRLSYHRNGLQVAVNAGTLFDRHP